MICSVEAGEGYRGVLGMNVVEVLFRFMAKVLVVSVSLSDILFVGAWIRSILKVSGRLTILLSCGTVLTPTAGRDNVW